MQRTDTPTEVQRTDTPTEVQDPVAALPPQDTKAPTMAADQGDSTTVALGAPTMEANAPAATAASNTALISQPKIKKPPSSSGISGATTLTVSRGELNLPQQPRESDGARRKYIVLALVAAVLIAGFLAFQVNRTSITPVATPPPSDAPLRAASTGKEDGSPEAKASSLIPDAASGKGGELPGKSHVTKKAKRPASTKSTRKTTKPGGLSRPRPASSKAAPPAKETTPTKIKTAPTPPPIPPPQNKTKSSKPKRIGEGTMAF